MNEPFARSRAVRANGIEQHALVWDGPEERTVLVLHGFLDQARSFAPLGDALARAGHRVVAPDFRGHGRSGWVPEGGYYHFPDYVADLCALLEQLGPAPGAGPLSVVAHSMGGSVATLFSGAFPARVRALVLAEGMGPPAMPAEIAPDRMERWVEQLAKPRARERKRLASLDEALLRLRVSHGDTVPERVLARVAEEQTVAHPSGDGLTWHFDPLHQTTSPARFDAEAFEAFARRITAPVLLLDGGPTGYAPPDAPARRGWYARHRARSLEGAGHMMHWTQPEAFAGAVLGFLREVGA